MGLVENSPDPRMSDMDEEKMLQGPSANGSAGGQEDDAGNPRMSNMDEEKKLQGPFANGSAGGQEEDASNPRMSDRDEEKMLQGPSANGSAGGQEEDAGIHSRARKRRIPPACFRWKWAIIAIAISVLLLASFGLGILVALKNCPKEAIKCPPDWIAHHGHCYKISVEEKNWKESQNFCILHDASLAKITEEEMDFVTKLTRNNVFWTDRKGGNAMLKVLGNGGDCPYLNDGTPSSGKCSIEHRYICKKN